MRRFIAYLIPFFLTVLVIGVIMAVLLVPLALMQDNPAAILKTFFLGPFGSIRHMGNVVEAATPIMLTGLAITILFRSGLFNLGAESGFFLGALGAVAGSFACTIPAALRLRFGASEMVTSLVLNYAFLFLGLFVLNYVIRDPNAGGMMSLRIPADAKLDRLLAGTRLNSGSIIAVLACIAGGIWLYWTRSGLNIRIAGSSPGFANHLGLPLKGIIMRAQIVGGLVAGMAGALEVLGLHARFAWLDLPGYGLWLDRPRRRHSGARKPVPAHSLRPLPRFRAGGRRSSGAQHEHPDRSGGPRNRRHHGGRDGKRHSQSSNRIAADQKLAQSRWRTSGSAGMTTVLAQILDPHFIGTILRVATPLLLAALGVMISDRAGVLNIGMEGMMLVAALIAVLASAATGSPAVGLLAALVVGALLGWLMSLSVNRLGTDLIMTGIALNIAAAAATTLGLYLATGDKGMSGALKSGALPSLAVPFIGNIHVLTFAALLAVPAVSLLMMRTRFGLHLRATGVDPKSARAAGIQTGRVQMMALILSGLFGGAAGAYLSLGYVTWFAQNMTAGRGFIAIAAEVMGQGTAWGTLVASLVLAAAESIAITLQSLGLPFELMQMIPYLVPVIVLTVHAARRQRRARRQITPETQET
ncbi:hypothetical protein H718_03232 [Brucella ovis IntaBari-2008-114-542]|nr:hypothetical protein H718_03232 [Brucella ovis IntaBari-2008-114-542]